MSRDGPNLKGVAGEGTAAVLIKTTLLVLTIVLLFRFLRKGYDARLKIARLRAAGLPIAPGWNYITGNLLLMAKMSRQIPSRATQVTTFGEIVRLFPEQGCCYLDLWPLSRPFLLVMDPDLGYQACQEEGIGSEKPPELAKFFAPIAGGPNLFDLSGKEWKSWRLVFNKGFSDSTIALLVPGMVEEAKKYCSKLAEKAKTNRMFQLDPMTLRYAIDFIGTAALNTRLNSQDGYDRLADSMLSQIEWLSKLKGSSPLERLDFVRSAVHWWNGRKMDKYIGEILNQRYSEHMKLEKQDSSLSKSIIDLILQSYTSSQADKAEGHDAKGSANGIRPAVLEPSFRAFAIRQIRLFLFVGHDSMSSTICYALHMLSTNPDALAKIRAEHDEILGTNLSAVPAKIGSDPNILSSLTYTTAVLKETLRLYPPGSGTRNGRSGVLLRTTSGLSLPTEGCLVWVIHIAMQRAPSYWHEPHKFIPERWIKSEDAKLQPRKWAWRPFEWGPRNCIGQNLAMTELRISLAMVIRSFDVKPAYDEWDRLHPPGSGITNYNGDRAYQVEEGAAHPADRYPCRANLTTAGKTIYGEG